MSDSFEKLPTLWGRGDSTNVQKVIWACEELGLIADRKLVGGKFGGTDAPEFAALNPNATVPVWQERDHTLWESQAILRHLARQSGKLYGHGAWGAAHVDQWLDWFATVLWPPVRLLFLQVFRDKTMTWNDAPARKALEQTDRSLTVLADQLSDHTFIATEELTIADIAVAIGLNRLHGMAAPVEYSASIAIWFDLMRTRPGFTVATEAEPDLPGHGARQLAGMA